MNRRVIAVAVIAAWVAALVLLYRRTTTVGPEQSLVEAGMRVAPATWYYVLEQGGRQVGAAASALDTTLTRIVSTDFVRGEFPVGDDTLAVEARAEARFTRGLRLRDFVVRTAGDLASFTQRGVIQEGEETVIRITTESPGQQALTLETPVTRPVFVPTVAPVPLMLRKRPRVGDSLVVEMYDPVQRAIRETTVRVEADSLFVLVDSATFDESSGRWVQAREDTIRGWRITRDRSPITVWVDIGGRLVAASEPGGVSLRRTAFELAFENWRIDHPAGPAGSRLPAAAGPPPPRRIRAR